MGKTYTCLNQKAAAERLQVLAQQPFDLTRPDALTGEGRLERYVCRAGTRHHP